MNANKTLLAIDDLTPSEIRVYADIAAKCARFDLVPPKLEDVVLGFGMTTEEATEALKRNLAKHKGRA